MAFNAYAECHYTVSLILSVTTHYYVHYNECRYTGFLSVFILSFVILSVSVVMPSPVYAQCHQ